MGRSRSVHDDASAKAMMVGWIGIARLGGNSRSKPKTESHMRRWHAYSYGWSVRQNWATLGLQVLIQVYRQLQSGERRLWQIKPTESLDPFRYNHTFSIILGRTWDCSHVVRSTHWSLKCEIISFPSFPWLVQYNATFHMPENDNILLSRVVNYTVVAPSDDVINLVRYRSLMLSFRTSWF